MHLFIAKPLIMTTMLIQSCIFIIIIQITLSEEIQIPPSATVEESKESKQHNDYLVGDLSYTYTKTEFGFPNGSHAKTLTVIKNIAVPSDKITKFNKNDDNNKRDEGNDKSYPELTSYTFYGSSDDNKEKHDEESAKKVEPQPEIEYLNIKPIDEEIARHSAIAQKKHIAELDAIRKANEKQNDKEDNQNEEVVVKKKLVNEDDKKLIIDKPIESVSTKLKSSETKEIYEELDDIKNPDNDAEIIDKHSVKQLETSQSYKVDGTGEYYRKPFSAKKPIEQQQLPYFYSSTSQKPYIAPQKAKKTYINHHHQQQQPLNHKYFNKPIGILSPEVNSRDSLKYSNINQAKKPLYSSINVKHLNPLSF